MIPNPVFVTAHVIAFGTLFIVCISSALAEVVINEIKAESSERMLRYHDNGAQSVGPDIPWWSPEFGDGDWQTGALPAGNGSSVATDLRDVLRNRTYSLYTRMTFTASATAAAANTLTLALNFNDGVIVWLNGKEVVRSNMGPEQGHFYADQQASRNGSSSQSGFEDFDISEFASSLVEGTNVIAVQLANESLSGTMWIDFSLTAGGEEVIPAGSDAQLRPGLTEPSGGLADFGALLDEAIAPGFSDWIELYNTGAASVDLSGWSLSDELAVPDKWTFPQGTTIAAGSYLMVLADKLPKATPTTADYLHANFALSSGGEYLGLFDATGTVQSAFDPDYPSQDPMHSYGRSASGDFVFFDLPSPGKPNAGPAYIGRVDAPDFDNKGGFYDAAVTIALTSNTPGATIRYTTDGTEPTESNGMDYTAPMTLERINDDEGHVIRARAFVDGRIPSRVKTNTFLIQQDEDLSSAPSLIYAADLGKKLYDPYGVLAIQGGTYSDGNWIARRDTDYNYVKNRGHAYERPIHAEFYFPDGTVGFRTDCGVRIAASNWSRPRMTLNQLARSPWPASSVEKPSFNLYFRNEYGNPSVTLPLNGPAAPVDTFEKFRVRAGKNDIQAPFVTDEVVRRMYRDMGNVSTTGVFNSLYVNGELKGFYNMVERLRTPFFGDHHGQTPGASWDVLALGAENGNVAEGDKRAWNDLVRLARGTMNDDNWEEILSMADIDSIADYYLVNIYMSMWDWPQNNWVAARERSDAGRYRFYVWDAEGGFGRGKSVSTNIIDSDLDSGSGELRQLWQGLRRWPQYRQAFADRVHKHFFNGGVLDDRDYANSHLKSIADDVTDEFGDLLLAVSRQRLNLSYISSWARESSGRRTYLFGPRRENFAGNDLWPATTPPEFSQFGGSVPEGFGLRITNEVGTVYYTTNGEDPRSTNGDPNPSAGSLAGSKLEVSLIERGSNWKYNDAGVDLGTNWRTNAYDDSAWQQGAAPLGYGSIVNTDFATTVNPTRANTTYFRRTFELDDASAMLSLQAEVQVDAACVVYINGQEAFRDGLPDGEEVTFDSVPENDGVEDAFDTFEVAPGLLRSGTNVIALDVKNQTATGGGSDMVIEFALMGTRTNPGNSAIPITGPMTVKARAINDGEWSALTEASFTVNTTPATSENIAVAEMLYNPVGPTDTELAAGATDGDQFEFLEIRNIGSQNVDLQGVRFTDGIAFDYSKGSIRSIAPGEHVIIVSDLAAFQLRYGNGFDGMIAGQFIGNLNNGGENVRLTGADDNALHEYAYSDSAPWPAEGDDGFSLQIVDASGDHATPTNWKVSPAIGGNPGPDNNTPPLTLAQWQTTFFSEEELQNPAFSGPEADADGDDASNFAEFVFGTSPRDSDARPAAPRGGLVEDGDGNRFVTVMITTAAEPRAITFSGESSTDLASWTATTVERINETADSEGRVEMTYRDLSPVQPGDERYLRMRMTAQ